MKTLYFAGPLFTQGERMWNARIAAYLEAAGYAVLLPQNQAVKIVTSVGGLTPAERMALFDAAVSSITAADAVLAVLDGPDADSGTCFECGYSYAMDRPVIGIRTDLRFGGDDKDSAANLMLSQSCKRILWIGMEALKKDDSHVADVVIKALREIGV